MLIRFYKWVLVLSLALSLGLHWALLQSVAWVSMVTQFSQDAPLKEALVKTFDGKHPCDICKAVQKGKKSEKRQASLKVETKLDFWLAAPALSLDAPPPFVVLPAGPDAGPARFESPPTPPPRRA